MKNAINYYYGLYPNTIGNLKDYFYFHINNKLYQLKPFTKDEKLIKPIYNLNQSMIIQNLPVHKIIPNQGQDIITIINNTPYILYQINISTKKSITLNDISYLSNQIINHDNTLFRSSWVTLWASNIDYFEYQINQIGKKHPYIVDSFNYYVGLAENAISYLQNTLIETKKEPSDTGVISHCKITKNSTILSLYDPENIIIDHKGRDIAEYIKSSFWNHNQNIFNELTTYFRYNYYSYYGMRVLFSRVLYPSFYFDLYEDILLNKVREKEINNITSQTKAYEQYLYQVYIFLKKYYNIPEIEWLKPK